MKIGAQIKVGKKSGVGAGVKIGRKSDVGAGVKIGKRKAGVGAEVKV